MHTFLSVIPKEATSEIELIGTNISRYKPNISVYLLLLCEYCNNVKAIPVIICIDRWSARERDTMQLFSLATQANCQLPEIEENPLKLVTFSIVQPYLAKQLL